MPFGDLLFVCSICEREIWDCARNGRERHLAPVCRYCEGFWTEHVRKLHVGAFMDRRRAFQICALSEVLHSTASRINWEKQYGRA